MTSAKALTLTAAAVAIGMIAITETGQAACYGAGCYGATRGYLYRPQDYAYSVSPSVYGSGYAASAYGSGYTPYLSTAYQFDPHAYGFVTDQPYSTLYAYGYASGLRSPYGCLAWDHNCPW